MLELKCCPSTLAEGFATYSPKAVKSLFNGQVVSHLLDFSVDELHSSGELENAMKRISVSGVQEKFPAVLDCKRIRLSQDNEQSTYILKPAPWDETLKERKQIPANENLTMQIASQVYGIITAENGLCFTKKSEPIYITKRFDIGANGDKITMEDFASLVGKNEQRLGSNFKYESSYEEIAKALRRSIAAWRVDMERFFELVVFNYIYGNGDDHLKNFSIVSIGDDYRLAPAYDLLNTALHAGDNDFGLDGGLSSNIEKSDIYVQTGHPCRLDFERFGTLIGLTDRRIQRILDKYMQLPLLTSQLVSNSFLDNKLKRSYLRIVEERTKRFIRQSE